MLKEFKEFAMKGNVMDLAIGVIIGGAFGKIVTSLVNDIIMPPIGFVLGGVDFSGLKFVIKAGSDGVADVAINYGMFLNTVIDFLIISFVIFLIVKQMNKFNRTESDKKVKVINHELIVLKEIRDLMKKKK